MRVCPKAKLKFIILICDFNTLELFIIHGAIGRASSVSDWLFLSSWFSWKISEISHLGQKWRVDKPKQEVHDSWTCTGYLARDNQLSLPKHKASLKVAFRYPGQSHMPTIVTSHLSTRVTSWQLPTCVSRLGVTINPVCITLPNLSAVNVR